MDDDIRFLIAEDEDTVRDLLRSVLEEMQFRDIHSAANGQEAFAKVLKLRPDILITDLVMPGMDGEELAKKSQLLLPDLTILVTTANGTIERAVRMVRQGVHDFITKPFSLQQLQASIGKGIQHSRSQPRFRGALEAVQALIVALESKDPYLGGHSKRVSGMAGRIARLAGWQKSRISIIESAAMVHDVGKIGVPESILKKPGPLTASEFEIIKKHPIYSRDILKPIRIFEEALPFIYHHHEKWDGRGYPDGIAGEAIPDGARIIAICDAFDAMALERPYRKAMPRSKILQIIREERGKHLDPGLVDLFLGRLGEIVEEPAHEQQLDACPA